MLGHRKWAPAKITIAQPSLEVDGSTVLQMNVTLQGSPCCREASNQWAEKKVPFVGRIQINSPRDLILFPDKQQIAELKC